MGLCKIIAGEGHSAPPLSVEIGPMPLPSAARSPASAEVCDANPCAGGCNGEALCKHYDVSREKCSKPGQVLVNWDCEQPCSCSSDGMVICSISYRCVDMTAEIEENKQSRRLPKIELAIPFSGRPLPTRELGPATNMDSVSEDEMEDSSPDEVLQMNSDFIEEVMP